MIDTLRTLHLSNNSLFDLQHANDNIDIQYINASTAMPIKSFSKLRKLVWLDLSKNRINHIGPNYLPRLLVTIDLSRNVFSSITTNTFEHLHELKILSLKDNLISKVTGIELMNKLRLEKFDLSLNNIDELPTNLFNGSIHCKAINFDKNFISFLPENVFMGLGTVHMVLAWNAIHTIDENAFGGLENTLEYLDLERNQLKNVPTSLLTLKKIRYLYLTSNTLSNIESLPNTLRVLSLAGNNLTHIPLHSLQSCTDLTYLNMGYNKIVEIQENGFNDWGNHLQTLLLRNNKITRLNYGTFNGLDSIKEISLSFNDIHYVHPMVFENISKTLKILELSFGVYREDFPIEQLKCLTELIWLGLDNNNLKFISDESLITMKELTYINLSFNRIMILPRNIYMAEVHKSLMDVDLSHNQISVIYPYTFDTLTNLQFVNLGFNRINELEKHSFNNLPYLQYIDLAYNNLKNVTESAFTFLPSLLHLDLMFNNMEYFTMKLFKHVSNETLPLTLNISNNRISHIDGEISSFLYIGCIDASKNLISDTQAFKNLGYALRILYLHGNNISNLTNHAFGDLEVLEILDLSHNKISILRRRSFYGLSNLQELKLSNNEIEQLQVEQFSNLKKLRILDLSFNKLKALPREVFLNTRLEYLNIANNQLGMWPVSAFSDVGFTLRNIQFNENQLEYLDSTMFINTQFIFELNLSKNKLTILPDNTFTFLNNLTDLDLSYNTIVTTNLKEILHHTPRIRKLNLNAMGLYSMPNVEAALNYLTELDLSMNYLQDISPLNKLKFLRVLRIAQNKLTNLTNFGDRLPLSLRVLDISWNPIKKTQLHDFVQIRYLEELYMENVKVTNSLFLSKLHNLKVLRIHSSFNFGDVIVRITGLQKLYIVMNESTLDDNLLAKLINHTKINLLEITGNRLTTITPNAFHGLSRNQKLHLRITNTQIAEFPPEIFYSLKNIPHLSIDLSFNRISSLSPGGFTIFRALFCTFFDMKILLKYFFVC